MPYVTANGVRLYYEERGTGAPIVGVHGAGSSALFWEDAAAELARLGRAIIYDRRGCTRSERPEPYDHTSVGEHAEDAHALLRALDAEPAILVGRSYGGTVALEVALRHPDSVRGIALLEAGPMGLSPEYDAWFEGLRGRLEALAGSGPDEAIAEAVALEVFGTWDELPDILRETWAANAPALLAEIRGEERVSSGLSIHDLQVPALVVTAADSPDHLQRGSAALEAALPEAQVSRVEGGHIIDPASPVVLEFVSGLLDG